MRKYFPWWLLVVCLTSATFFWGYGLAPWSLGYPVECGGDLWQTCRLLKSALGPGGRFACQDLGAPFIADHTSYPDTFIIHLPVLWLLHLLNDNVFLHYNLLIWLGFVWTGLTAFHVLHWMGCRPFLAALVGWLYASLPNHLERYDHFGLTFYAAAPLAIYYAIRIQRGERLAWRELSWALVCGLCGPYYAYFTCLVVAFSGLWTSGLARSSRAVVEAFKVCATVFLAFFLAAIPVLLLRSSESVAVPTRNSTDLSRWALGFDHLVLPAHSQSWHPLHSLSQKYYAEFPAPTEPNEAPYLGISALLGGCCLLVGHSRHQPHLRRLAVLVALIGFPAGLGQLLTLVFGNSIRCYNRISFYLAFVLLAALAVQLQTSAFWLRHKRLLAALVLLGIFEQLLSVPPREPGRWRSESVSDRDFVREIERRLEPGSMVWQYPYAAYPETEPRWREGAYAPGRCYAVSQGIRWSWGAPKGTTAALYQEALERLSLTDQLGVLARSGFAGLTVERRAYKDHGEVFEKALGVNGLRLGFVSRDQNLAFYTLGPRLAPSPSAGDVFCEQILAHAAYATEGVDFTSSGWPSLFLRKGWGVPEVDGTWTVGSQAFLSLPPSSASHPVAVELLIQPFVGSQGQHLEIYDGRSRLASLPFSDEGRRWVSLRVSLPVMLCLKVARPTAPGPLDRRPLGIKLVRLRWSYVN